MLRAYEARPSLPTRPMRPRSPPWRGGVTGSVVSLARRERPRGATRRSPASPSPEHSPTHEAAGRLAAACQGAQSRAQGARKSRHGSA